MRVRRTLPQRDRSLVGAWCFADHYGPDPVAETGGMVVPPHPHTGLQTVSWLFVGEVEHRDSAGHHALVRPGELNLMTGGHGVSHSEVSTAGTEVLHGVQLWVALPEAARDVPADFDHYAPPVLSGPGWTAAVFLGSAAGPHLARRDGHTAPRRRDPPRARHHPRPGRGRVLRARRPGRHRVRRGGRPTVKPAELAYVEPGRRTLALEALEASRIVLLGGPPFGEQIVMWWNFVGRTHDEVVAFRREWQEQITRAGAVVGDSQDVADGRFGVVLGDHLPPIPAPPLPTARLKPRG